ncbi:hypothetical protein [Rhodococcus sp. NPDC004095]
MACRQRRPARIGRRHLTEDVSEEAKSDVIAACGLGWIIADDYDGEQFRRRLLAEFPVNDELIDAMRVAATAKVQQLIRPPGW